ncbi:MAG: hypothetical protein AAGD34_11620 [Pseudomonadota bacterium]
MLWIHAGTNKTGTTSIQASLEASRPWLAKNGILYPGTTLNHHHLARAAEAGEEAMTAAVDALDHAAKGNGRATTTIISTERLQSITLEMKRRFVRTLENKYGPARLLIYLREPVDHATSSAAQAIKTRTKTYEEICTDPKIFAYREQLTEWKQVLGNANMTVRKFDRASLKGDAVEDFMHAIDAGSLLNGLTVVRRNESISMAAARALSAHAHLSREDGFHDTPVGALLKVGGPKFRLPDWTVGYIQARVEEDMAWLEKAYGITFDTTPRLQIEPDPLAEALARTAHGLHLTAARQQRQLRARTEAGNEASPPKD